MGATWGFAARFKSPSRYKYGRYKFSLDARAIAVFRSIAAIGRHYYQ
jgi:hypothetical protein